MKPRTLSGPELIQENREFYDALWTDARLVGPESFNTWPLVSSLVSHSRRPLEVAPGLRPRLPLEGTLFVDMSLPAVAKLRAGGANAVVGLVSSGATFLLAVPLHPSHWSAFDDFVGHRRRYEPERLLEKLAEHGFSVTQSAVYGMQPRSSRLLDLGMWCLTHRRERAMWWYNRVFMPFGSRFQKKLSLVDGTIDTERVDEVLLVCRKESAS
jgi:hypothetical protein